MEKPLVSIIILTYNNFSYFKQCIDSVLCQDYNKIELIISDDFSNSFDEKSIKSYLETKKASNIMNYKIIMNKQNLGTVKSFNNAIKNSNGDYIIPLAIDDCFNNNKVISSIVDKFISSNSLILTGYRNVYNENLDKFICKMPNSKQVKLIEGDISKLYNDLCKKNFISGACTAYSKRLFNLYGFFDEEYRLLEDLPKFLQLLRKNVRIEFLDIPIIKYRLGGISTSNKVNPILRNDLELVIKKEILPYRRNVGVFIYRLKKFEYLKNSLLESKHKLIIFYIDIVMYKIYCKLNKFLKDLINS
ncbi:glycosyltransferase [Clostridium sp.]|uniref:glycosyltransferase n=1 Tax=Clostridium sp. TaxID=1506 RepID=UPI00261B307E|nr:glycosyltransferase [Clostridium sp.]